MTATVFIDGDVGTTGLQIRERLAGRSDIVLLRLDEHERKDTDRRRAMLNTAAVSILCLPDDAAREAAALTENPESRLIDASTAHRTADGWIYGFPEYAPGQAEEIAAAKRVSNPGCYALTAVSILHPLVDAGLVPADWPITINAVSGYSGGGKALISSFENADDANATSDNFRVYGLSLSHKHLPEITHWSGLGHTPIFVPSVGRFAQGMIVQVPLALWAMPGMPTAGQIHAALADHYAQTTGGSVEVAPLEDTRAMTGLEPETLNGTDRLRLHVFANEADGQCVVMGLLDNLGKGASGQAVQNLDLMIGVA